MVKQRKKNTKKKRNCKAFMANHMGRNLLSTLILLILAYISYCKSYKKKVAIHKYLQPAVFYVKNI